MEIKRDIYVERLKRRMGNQQIKVITGIRRCGKSFLLAILRQGLIDIPLMFALRPLFPVYGIVMATPLADAFCCIAANWMFTLFLRNLLGCGRDLPSADCNRDVSPNCSQDVPVNP